jgi:hypothetical protein
MFSLICPPNHFLPLFKRSVPTKLHHSEKHATSSILALLHAISKHYNAEHYAYIACCLLNVSRHMEHFAKESV